MSYAMIDMNDLCNIPSLIQEEVHFGFNLNQMLNATLQKAAASIASRNEALKALKEAYRMSPDQLEVLMALYKFYCYQGDIEQAEDLIFQTLIKSALKGGFSHKWDTLKKESANWNTIRGPERIFLYSLKALAFIRLKQDDLKTCEDILKSLNRIDPNDQVGADVIRSLLDAMYEEQEHEYSS